jgi:excisionase family DNA binding protein
MADPERVRATAAERPYTTATLAERWGCSDQHVRDMIARGELACFRLGKLIRIAAAEVARIEGCGCNSTGASGARSGPTAAEPAAHPFGHPIVLLPSSDSRTRGGGR